MVLSYSSYFAGFLNIFRVMLSGASLYVTVCSTSKFWDTLSSVQGWLDNIIDCVTYVFLGLASWSLVPVISSIVGPLFAAVLSLAGPSTPVAIAATVVPGAPLDQTLVTAGFAAILLVLGCVAGTGHEDR